MTHEVQSADSFPIFETMTAGEAVDGGPIHGSFPMVDDQRELILGPDETIVEEWVVPGVTQAKQGDDRKFVSKAIASKSRVRVTLTDRRLVVVVPEEWALVYGDSRGPQRANSLQRLGLKAASRVLGKLEDGMGPAVEAAHIPLECVNNVSPTYGGKKKSKVVVMYQYGAERSRFGIIDIGADERTSQEITTALLDQVVERWRTVTAGLLGDDEIGWDRSSKSESWTAKVYRRFGGSTLVFDGKPNQELPPERARLRLDPGGTLYEAS